MPGCPQCSTSTAACKHVPTQPPSLLINSHTITTCTALINTFSGYMPVGGVKGMDGADGVSRLSGDWAEVGCTPASGIWLHNA